MGVERKNEEEEGEGGRGPECKELVSDQESHLPISNLRGVEL